MFVCCFIICFFKRTNYNLSVQPFCSSFAKVWKNWIKTKTFFIIQTYQIKYIYICSHSDTLANCVLAILMQYNLIALNVKLNCAGYIYSYDILWCRDFKYIKHNVFNNLFFYYYLWLNMNVIWICWNGYSIYFTYTMYMYSFIVILQ